MPPYSPPPPWSFAPFALLLLAIAVLPLVHRTAHWWERNRNKLLVALCLSGVMLLYYGLIHPGVKDPHHEGHLLRGVDAVVLVLEHAILSDYVPFIVLLFSLYTISGGIVLRGDIQARPATNCAFLAAGSILASLMGTTGASMLLIRPILRTNSERKHVVHTIIFFIFLVSNIGGSLTPLGDPPLFLGYLRGVPFSWTLRLFFPWLFLNCALLVVYYIWDRIAYRREELRAVVADEMQVQPLSVGGSVNFIWLILVVAAVALVDSSREIPLLGVKPFPWAREAILLGLAAVSWFTTPRNAAIRKENAFNFIAIVEVAFLFVGIFICMQAPVEFLREEGGKLGISTAPAFFWATGALSSFLDNAPTYVVYFNSASSVTESLLASGTVPASAVLALPPSAYMPEGGHVLHLFLLAVSMGAVFMGANTYIGNGPNFMVKAIAEQSGVKMPSFFGYMAYSICVLIPLFVITMLLFL